MLKTVKKIIGLLIMRLGLAAVLLWHSVPKLIGGAPAWKSVGTTMDFINLGLPVSFMGLLSLTLETLCSVGLIFGYLFRLSSGVLFVLLLFYSFNYFNVAYKTLMMWSAGADERFSGAYLYRSRAVFSISQVG